MRELRDDSEIPATTSNDVPTKQQDLNDAHDAEAAKIRTHNRPSPQLTTSGGAGSDNMTQSTNAFARLQNDVYIYLKYFVAYLAQL